MTADTPTPTDTAKTHQPKRQPWALPLNKVEDFEIKVVAGCPFCEFDEAEGGLFNHCKDCQQEITTAAYELFVRLDHSMQPRAAHDALVEACDAAMQVIGELPPTQARVEVAQMLQAALKLVTP